MLLKENSIQAYIYKNILMMPLKNLIEIWSSTTNMQKKFL